MQPTYIPWSGYFELIAATDVFVFLDDVKYSHQSWQNRNYFCFAGQKWLSSVPVQDPKKRKMLLNVKLHNPSYYGAKLEKSIRQNYSKSPHLHFATELLKEFYSPSNKSLAVRNGTLIKNVCDFLSIETSFFFASELKNFGKRAELIIEILKTLNATEYLCAPGARDYMQQYGVDQFPCRVTYFQYPISTRLPTDKDGTNYSILHHIMSETVTKNTLQMGG